MNNKFTILTSNYNKEQWLGDWANSILAQQYRPLEVVVVDDFSDDNSRKILEKYRERFLNRGIEIIIIHNEKRLYCGSSYRNSVKYASGGFFGVLDADDMLVDDAVEYIMKIYKKNKNIAWIYTQFVICDLKMREKRKGFSRCPGKGKSLLDLADKGKHGIGCGWRTFNYKIDKKHQYQLFAEGRTCAVDKYMAYKLEELGPGLFIDRVCYKHRQHPIGSTDSVSSTKYAMEMWEEVVREFKKKRKKNNIKPYVIKNNE